MLRDHFNRRINYMRLSVTDHCNLRCRYCVPDGQLMTTPDNQMLSYEDMYRICQAAVDIGIEKIRITGGEPLVRKGIVDFIADLSPIKGLKELVLTTNGILLSQYAHTLKDAGLSRVNISLDTLNSRIFSSITRGGALLKVQEGIHAAIRIGLPVKINVVVMRGINDKEISDFVNLTLLKNISVRFIEYMQVGNDSNWEKLTIPSEEILNKISDCFDYIPELHDPMAGPAINYRVIGALGTFGVISPVSGHICQSCNRIRVSSIGKAKACLFADEEIDLRPALNQVGPHELTQSIQRLVENKRGSHGMSFYRDRSSSFQMSSIGG